MAEHTPPPPPPPPYATSLLFPPPDVQPMDTGAEDDEEIAMSMDEYFRSLPSPNRDGHPAEEEEEHVEDDDNGDSVEIRAAMATLSNAGGRHRQASGTPSSFAVGAGQGSLPRSSSDEKIGPEEGKYQKLNDQPSSDVGFETSEDDDVPVAVPVESADDGEVSAADAKTSSLKAEGGDASEDATKRLDSEASTSSSAKKTKKKPPKGGGGSGDIGGGAGSGGGMTRSKPYQGSYRSAAAAHRNRQIHVPPIGSPGLLMLPTPAATAAFPHDGNDEDEVWYKKWLIRGEYLLPSDVFRRSMIAGGYTFDKRRERPHRGSSTERCVGDMFDSDAGGLYLHFPELIPPSVCERRLGDDDMGRADDESPQASNSATRGGGKDGGRTKDPSDAASRKDGTTDDPYKPKGPKGARSSYIFFTNDQRPKMMIEFPGMRFTEQGVIMGERWRALTPEEKKPYEDLANKDKERYSKEMKEYIESVKREIKEEKECSSPAKLAAGGDGQENDETKEGGDQVEGGGSEGHELAERHSKDKSVQGPRLVDVVILSLSKMLGERVNRKEAPPLPQAETVLLSLEPEKQELMSSAPALPELVSSSESKPPEPMSSAPEPLKENAAVPHRRFVSPDLTPDELPRFGRPLTPRTLRRPRPHVPMSFLDMIPVSLTSTYPPSYVARRAAYAQAVWEREEAVADFQEAMDDADDAREKYEAHTEAWERMLEYQKGQVAKREAERKRQQEEEEMEAAEQEEMEERTSENDGTSTGAGDGVEGEAKKELLEETTTPNESKTENGGNAAGGVGETKKLRPPTPPPEDPMECMPPRPQPPGPARIVSIPDIPIPPSPPLVVAVEDDEEGGDGETNGNGSAGQMKSEGATHDLPMQAPKVDNKLIQHLDPACFLPSMEGRYFGLLSNHIADPQFCGILAPGIAGTTYGGGTGLATSYVGGGRGAVGLVSGPLRGGNMWERAASSSGSKGGSGGGEKSERNEGKRSIIKCDSTDEPMLPKSTVATPDAVKSSTKEPVPGTETATSSAKDGDNDSTPLPKQKQPSLSTPFSAASSSTKKKRGTSDVASSKPSPAIAEATDKEKKKKKLKRTTIGLATGDRNTSATEIASGAAGSEFPDGWIIKTYRRSGGETIGKTDRFWFSPGRNIRFRAKKHAKAFVEILLEPDVGGDEDKAAEIYRARGLHF